MFLPDNTPAPTFSLRAQVSDRLVTLKSATGALLLIFHSYQTAPDVAGVIRAVRVSYPSPDQVLIAGVADMRVVPRFLRGTAKTIIRNAYLEASKQIPAGQNPADHIIILADWNGAFNKAYRVPPTNRHVALVLINDAKLISGSYFGPQPEQAVLSLLASERNSSDPQST